MRTLLGVACVLILVMARSGGAATFAFVPPADGFQYSVSGVACAPACGGNQYDPGPLMVKYSTGIDVVGMEAAVQPYAVTVGGWARAGSGSSSYLARSYTAIEILPEPGEQVGDPVTVYVHSKAFITLNAEVTHNVWVNTVAVFARNYDGFQDPLWTREVVPLDLQIGDRLQLGSQGAAGFSWSDPGDTADSRLQVSFSEIPPPDPPIAVPLGRAAAMVLAVTLLAAGLVQVSRRVAVA